MSNNTEQHRRECEARFVLKMSDTRRKEAIRRDYENAKVCYAAIAADIEAEARKVCVSV